LTITKEVKLLAPNVIFNVTKPLRYHLPESFTQLSVFFLFNLKMKILRTSLFLCKS